MSIVSLRDFALDRTEQAVLANPLAIRGVVEWGITIIPEEVGGLRPVADYNRVLN